MAVALDAVVVIFTAEWVCLRVKHTHCHGNRKASGKVIFYFTIEFL